MLDRIPHRTLPGADWHVDETIATKYDFAEHRIRLRIIGGDHHEIGERGSAERIGWGMQEDRRDGHTITMNLTIKEIRNLLTIMRVEEEASTRSTALPDDDKRRPERRMGVIRGPGAIHEFDDGLPESLGSTDTRIFCQGRYRARR